MKYLLNAQFWWVDVDGNYTEDTSFGTYEKTSDDPLTVKYTVADDSSGPTARRSTQPTCSSAGRARAAT